MIERYWGNNEWYLNGKLHRDDGPAIYSTHGVKKWYKHGLIHREGGPAIEYVDVKYYLQNDKYHRIDGPAVVYYDGRKEWFLQDKYYGKNDKFTNESWMHFQKCMIF